MRTILAAVVLTACAAGLTAQDAKKYEKEGKFTAKFPTGPTEQTKTAQGLALHVFVADFENGKGGYLVTYADLPPEVLKAPKPEQVLESGAKGLEQTFKAKLTKSAESKFGPKMFPAREIAAEREMFHLRGTVVLVGSRMYQVYVFGDKDFVAGKQADEFLASFAITD